MAADIGTVLSIVATDGDRLGHAIDVGLTIIGSVLGDGPITWRKHDGWLVCGARGRRISRL
jgi:hypothetical protein